jgi:hypothetical protein
VREAEAYCRSAVQGSPSPTVTGGPRVGVGFRLVPRVYVGAPWALMPSRAAGVPARISIFDTNIHPKYPRLYLNDRFIGIAGDFDGCRD